MLSSFDDTGQEQGQLQLPEKLNGDDHIKAQPTLTSEISMLMDIDVEDGEKGRMIIGRRGGKEDEEDEKKAVIGEEDDHNKKASSSWCSSLRLPSPPCSFSSITRRRGEDASTSAAVSVSPSMMMLQQQQREQPPLHEGGRILSTEASFVFDCCAQGWMGLLQRMAAGRKDARTHALLTNPHPDHYQRTPLMAAAHGGQKEMVVVLLSMLEDTITLVLNERDEVGMTALSLAAAEGHTEVMEILLNHGADPFLPDHEGYTPLMLAAGHDHMEAATLLLDRLSSPSQVSSMLNTINPMWGETALWLAVSEGHLDMVAMLLSRGADPSLTLCPSPSNPYHNLPKAQSALDLAQSKGGPTHESLVKLLVVYGINQSHLHHPEHHHHHHQQQQKEEGGRKHRQQQQGGTGRGRSGGGMIIENITQFLAPAPAPFAAGRRGIERCASGNKQGDGERERGGISSSCCGASYQQGRGGGEGGVGSSASSTTSSSSSDSSSLYEGRGLMTPSTSTLAHLLSSGGLTLHQNYPSHHHYQPHRHQHHYQHQATAAEENDNNNTDNNNMMIQEAPPSPFPSQHALWEACRKGDVETVAYLLLQEPSLAQARDLDAFDMTGLMMACEAGQVEIARLLIRYGAPIEAVDGNGSTALLLAALEGQLEIAELLIEEAGADIEHYDDDGDTPLMVAACGGFDDVVAYLLEKGARPETTSKGGKTALHWAARHGERRVCKVLLAGGAKATCEDRGGRTPLDVARLNGHMDCARVISRYL